MKLTPEQRRFWNVIKYDYDINKELDGNPDILEAIETSQRLDRVIEPLAYYMFNLCNRIIIREGYKTLTFKEDMLHYAFEIAMRSILKFDKNKSVNPFAYMSTVIHSGCLKYMAAEQKQRDIKKELADRVLHGQVN